MKIVTDTKNNAVVLLDDDLEFISATTTANFNKVVSEGTGVFDSGLVLQEGSGLLSFKKTGAYTQIAYQVDKGNYMVRWGQHENDDEADLVSLAHPYKVFIADFHEDLLVGLRHFFVPEPIFSLKDPLYHAPFPNTNCRGYQGTSVGWVCLYRTGNTPLVSVQEKIQYAYERESALHEPYNNDNMSHTDGPRFYNDHGIGYYLTPNAWIQKTSEEGNGNWILDAEKLIVVKTSDPFSITHDEKGDVYTLEKALNMPYMPYYPSRLSAQQKNFYENGWGNNLESNLDYTPQMISKISSVPLSEEINISDIISGIGGANKKIIDFAKWNSTAKADLGKTIINLKTKCCLCSNPIVNQSDVMKLVPFFHTQILEEITSDIKRSLPAFDAGNKKLKFLDYVVVPVDLNLTILEMEEDYNSGVNEEEEISLHLANYVSKIYEDVCSTCAATHLHKAVDTHGNIVFLNSKDSFETQYLELSEEESFLYTQYLELLEITGESETVSFYLTNVGITLPENYIGQKLVPSNFTIECLHCGLIHASYIDSFNKNQIFPLTIPSNNLENVYSKKLTQFCPSCATKINNLLPKELFVSANSIPQPLSEFSDCMTDSMTKIDPNSLYSFSIANHNTALVYAEAKSQFEENSLYLYENWPQKFITHYQLSSFEYAIVTSEGVPYLIVDIPHNIENKLLHCNTCNGIILSGNICDNCDQLITK